MINFLIEELVFGDELHPFVKAIENAGHKATIVHHTPFIEVFEEKFNYELSDPTVFFGSLNLGRMITRKKPWWPGCIYEERCFDCTYYYSIFKYDLANYDCVFLPMGMIGGRHYGKFIRPNSGSKPFTGICVHTESDYKMISRAVRPEILCLVAGQIPQPFKEYRFFVYDGRVYTGSLYMNAGVITSDTEIPEIVTRYAKELALKYNEKFGKEVGPYTLDVAFNSYNGWLSIMEVNSFSCSGIYLADPAKIVEMTEKYIQDMMI